MWGGGARGEGRSACGESCTSSGGSGVSEVGSWEGGTRIKIPRVLDTAVHVTSAALTPVYNYRDLWSWHLPAGRPRDPKTCAAWARGACWGSWKRSPWPRCAAECSNLLALPLRSSTDNRLKRRLFIMIVKHNMRLFFSGRVRKGL